MVNIIIKKKKKKTKKNYLKCFDTKGNCSIDFQCAGRVCCAAIGKKKNYTLVVFFLFLCHLSCYIYRLLLLLFEMSVFVHRMNAFAHSGLGKKTFAHLHLSKQPIRIKPIRWNHYFSEFRFKSHQ